MRRIKQRLISTCPQLPYLSEIFNEEFSNVIIKSEDGNEIRINHLFMASWSKFSKELLQDALSYKDKEVVISSNFTRSDLKIFQDFVMKGALPCSESVIINNKLSKDIDNLFLSFGINLSYIVNTFFMKIDSRNKELPMTSTSQSEDIGEPFAKKIKVEPDFYYDDNMESIAKIPNEGDPLALNATNDEMALKIMPAPEPPDHEFVIKEQKIKSGENAGQSKYFVTLLVPPYMFKRRRDADKGIV